MNNKKRYLSALTIAGSDSGGGAGIQADLKTFSAIGVFGISVITAITAQNTQEVRAIETLSPSIIRQQLETVLDDMLIDTVKTGMLPNSDTVEIVASIIDRYNLQTVIMDPVMISTTGSKLVSASTIHSFREELYKRITLITPNIPEAEILSGIKITQESDMQKAADVLLNQGCNAVLIKGGHLPKANVVDIFFSQNKAPVSFSSKNIRTSNLHGTGCTLSSAIAAYMALGMDIEIAVRAAKQYITNAIYSGKDIITGKGCGPLNHFFKPEPLNTKQYDY
ncbi:bifunctional hydroxymethylpyrimidine kinase/phosphomethylpyrimidine kinase [Dysgonomonas sp. ZJ709]|uniref:bifunctional hydroxymethylpyrimidine kinase/phosphomethylpyrimidine kinase n=1 Tax=Dysgonomonas sp. ZJ709 TaxID=2709797 RepID=UPI0013EC0903|nr:bifunctional hydroxymethylpyrimidine kinase/phosphomethylpyrimidine kinase [Dysgonomonas sp. ZJ709]